MKGQNFRAGLFVFASLLILIILILRVSQGNLFFESTYPLYLEVDSAVGLGKNTPVKIAGVDVGVVKDVQLLPSGKAKVELSIDDDFVIRHGVQGMVKTTGILGDAYIELAHSNYQAQPLEEGAVVTDVVNFGDFNSVTNKLGSIADDVKAITAQMKTLMAGSDSSFSKSMKNIEKITNSLAQVTTANQQNINAIIANMKALSQNLNNIVAQNSAGVNRSVYNLEDITGTIARGEGTVGRLVKDEETVDKLNSALDGINSFLGGANRLRVDLGMHTEYLAGTGDFKNYVSLALKPRPDKYFLFQVVSDPDPSYTTRIDETTVTANGSTSTVTTETRSKQLNGLLFSAQLAKKFEDFTIRGGLIESSGGVGLDYNKGPLGMQFSAFDFKSDAGQRPHLKAMGTAQVTKTFYLLGGVDDFINKNQDLAWFVGAGMTFTDDDIKSLLGLLANASR